MDYDALVLQLESLVSETFALWDPGWVTFNWRAYTYDHVQRVRYLALTLYSRERGVDLKASPLPQDLGAERAVVELASLLHDICKPYDGEYLTDAQGKRVLDENGYWRNEVRRPARTNRVTDLYDQLGLQGQLHHESGATLAYHLLQGYGMDEAICLRVAQAIRDHLQPRPDAALEGRCLYDADTIDANIGLPAFVRNIYINLHFHDLRKAPETPPIETLLGATPLAFLQPYVMEKLPTWSEGKQRDFVPRLLTAAARQLAATRLQRLCDTWTLLAQELGAFERNSVHGRLAVVLHFMRHRDDPSIAAETSFLRDHWLAMNGASPEAREFIAQLQCEMAGVE